MVGALGGLAAIVLRVAVIGDRPPTQGPALRARGDDPRQPRRRSVYSARSPGEYEPDRRDALIRLVRMRSAADQPAGLLVNQPGPTPRRLLRSGLGYCARSRRSVPSEFRLSRLGPWPLKAQTSSPRGRSAPTRMRSPAGRSCRTRPA